MTIFDLLTLMFIVSVPLLIGQVIAIHFGVWTGIGTGVLSGIACITIIGLFHRRRWRKNARQRREYKEKYTRIYRVLTTPTDEAAIRKAHGAEIKIGDFGWEAAPLRDDGLIYLHGLNLQWRVVWYAGFCPEQIEHVTVKPQSQYDWNYTWIHNPPPCPFPVQEHFHPTVNMGFPLPVNRK